MFVIIKNVEFITTIHNDEVFVWFNVLCMTLMFMFVKPTVRYLSCQFYFVVLKKVIL